MDAITLSMAELSKTGVLGMDKAAFAIVLAAMSNTMIKGGVALMAESLTLRKSLLPGIIMILVTGIGVLFLL